MDSVLHKIFVLIKYQKYILLIYNHFNFSSQLVVNV